MNDYTQLSPILNQQLANLQEGLVGFPVVLKDMCYDVFYDTLFVNHEEIESKRQIEKKKLKEKSKRDDIARIPEDLKRIEQIYPAREAKHHQHDLQIGFVPDETISQMRKESFIKRNLTEYQRRQLYPESNDPKEEKTLRKIEKEKFSIYRKEGNSIVKEDLDYKMIPQAVMVVTIVAIVYISNEILKKFGLNFKKGVEISCLGLIGYAIYTAI